MQDDLKSEYAEIGRQRGDAGRIHTREARWFAVKVIGVCWLWVIIGGAVMANAFHINASVGQFYFPKAMARAELYFNAGLFVGIAGPLATLIIAWRMALNRGYVD